ncbi:chemotaxis protein CheB [Scytonema sp. UIC 10036]|uniref:chemotaxis protein CheB n=1 Tax=Scytonema sp. UIC 10036 TaxID=2304196 RepID=UPI0012DA7B88|nr:chemotaxis protein CheB [Scytonema sp. UIC 10036]MUG96905.1 chemotaxis protein CheB [Scytonema sp. UIC 10036]
MTNKQEHSALFHLPKTTYDIVALAASLGGLKTISQILSALPSDFPAAITVVQHLHRWSPSLMTEILGRRTSLAVKQASSGDQLRSGTVYIAPPNQHLLVNPDGTLSLSIAEQVNFVRPSADLLFSSVAVSFKERAIAVVLTGRGCDGARGVQEIRKMGGVVLAQNESTCECSSMPGFAIDTGCVDLVLPPNKIAFALETLVMIPETDTSYDNKTPLVV